MSRTLNQINDTEYGEKVINTDECRWLYDEVCRNDKSEHCCDFPNTKYDCKRCKLFESEDSDDC